MRKFLFKKVILSSLILLIPLLAGTQELRPVIKINPFASYGISGEETRFIESLIQSYVADAGQLSYHMDDSPADYILSGSIHRERDNHIFTLKILDGNSKELSSSKTTHNSSGDLVLKARSLVENVLRNNVYSTRTVSPTNGHEAEAPEEISASSVIGSWRGEEGTELIRLRSGGSGVVFLSSGVQINLYYTVEDNIVIIDAPPMHWEMQLFQGGSRLRGMNSSNNSFWVRSR